MDLAASSIENLGTVNWYLSNTTPLSSIINDNGTLVFHVNTDLASATLPSNGTIEFAAGTTASVSSNWTMSASLMLVIDSGAYLTAGTSVTLTNYGEIDLPTGADASFITNAGAGVVNFP